MFCKNCGKEISDDTKFCNHCGAAQDSSSAQPSAQPVQPAAPAPQPGTAPKKKPHNTRYHCGSCHCGNRLGHVCNCAGYVRKQRAGANWRILCNGW